MKSLILFLKNFVYPNFEFHSNESDFFFFENYVEIDDNFAGYDSILTDYQKHTNTFRKKY
jgi:hypothetical protein